MSFKVKNSQLSSEVLQVLNQLIEQDIDASCAFRLTRIIKHLSSIVEDKVKDKEKSVMVNYEKFWKLFFEISLYLKMIIFCV